MDNYWREQVLEVIKATKYGVDKLNGDLMDVDTIKILLKNVKVVLNDDENLKQAIIIIDGIFSNLNDKKINISNIKSNLDILEGIIKRELK